MISAIDTNILLDILRPNPEFVECSIRVLESSDEEGPLVICEVVYAELAANFRRQEELESFLAENKIRLEPTHRESTFMAGYAWRRYRRDGGPRKRILSDFLIGAHADLQSGRLISRDRGFYRSYFPRLTVVDGS